MKAARCSNVNIFSKKVKLKYLSIVITEPERIQTVYNFHKELKKAGIKQLYYDSTGISQEWLTWRRELNQFASILFK